MSECKSKKCCKSLQGTVTVQRVFQNGKIVLENDDTVEKINLPLMEGVPTATVSADRGLTKNLGSFNSLKLSVFCSVPAYLEETEMKNALDFCVNFCESRIQKDCDEFYAYLTAKYPDIFKKIP